jgi:hypothetical protein
MGRELTVVEKTYCAIIAQIISASLIPEGIKYMDFGKILVDLKELYERGYEDGVEDEHGESRKPL